jgi:hypothetical protein
MSVGDHALVKLRYSLAETALAARIAGGYSSAPFWP